MNHLEGRTCLAKARPQVKDFKCHEFVDPTTFWTAVPGLRASPVFAGHAFLLICVEPSVGHTSGLN